MRIAANSEIKLYCDAHHIGARGFGLDCGLFKQTIPNETTEQFTMTRSMIDPVKEWSRADIMIRELNDRELDEVVGGNFGLYKINLSGVVSKYIGETEKNLGRIF